MFKSQKLFIMGKGDKKTRRGKINQGSYGKTRPKKSVKPVSEKENVKSETEKEEPKTKIVKPKTEKEEKAKADKKTKTEE